MIPLFAYTRAAASWLLFWDEVCTDWMQFWFPRPRPRLEPEVQRLVAAARPKSAGVRCNTGGL